MKQAQLVRDLMQADPPTAFGSSKLSELVILMRERSIQHLPIIENSEIIGVLNYKSSGLGLNYAFFPRYLEKNGERTINDLALDVLDSDPLYLSDQETIQRALGEMSFKKTDYALVKAENGHLVGLLSVWNLMELLREFVAAEEGHRVRKKVWDILYGDDLTVFPLRA